MKHINIFLTALLIFFVGCSSTDEPPINEQDDPIDYSIPTEECNRTLLIYSVAANNLQPTLRGDSLEMMAGAHEISGLAHDNRVLLYFASREGKPTLSELTLDKEGRGIFRLIKTYERTIASTNPERMKQVWQDVEYYRPAKKYSMILESHATGWTPYFSRSLDDQLSQDGLSSVIAKSFGSDQSLGKTDQMDILELGKVFCDHQLDFIWFDACYMAGIETTYQLRNKANTYIGYVTEIWGEGVPYDKVLPMIAGDTPDLIGAAKKVFDYFNDSRQPVSISVTDLSCLEALAVSTRPFATVEEIPYIDFTHNYARYSNGPFYDFGQYINYVGSNLDNAEADLQEFNNALSDAVIYKEISERDFTGLKVNRDAYSGLSTHIPGQRRTLPANEEYWFLTDWAKDVYPSRK